MHYRMYRNCPYVVCQGEALGHKAKQAQQAWYWALDAEADPKAFHGPHETRDDAEMAAEQALRG